MLILCCCSVRNSTPSTPPSIAIISGLVVTAVSPLGTTTKGGLVTPLNIILVAAPVSILMTTTVSWLVVATHGILIAIMRSFVLILGSELSGCCRFIAPAISWSWPGVSSRFSRTANRDWVPNPSRPSPNVQGNSFCSQLGCHLLSG
nr:hypothetical protein Iba_chr04cCG14700 [Ipomoea batatas]